MRTIYILLTGLALMSLACLTSALTPAAMTQTPAAGDLVSPAPAIVKQDEQPDLDPAAAKLIQARDPDCAVISAERALHLRVAADPRSRVLAYMSSGEVVKVISTSQPDWWLIQYENRIGYARAKYMQEQECAESEQE